jgi:hypothetical protein
MSTISEKISLEDLVLLGDKIHNADEIICLTHKVVGDDAHDLHFTLIGERDSLAHLIAKQCCENEEFLDIILLALDKLNLSVVCIVKLMEILKNK